VSGLADVMRVVDGKITEYAIVERTEARRPDGHRASVSQFVTSGVV
jgi:hypothetical protein